MTRRRRWALAVAVVAAVGGPVIGGALTARSQVVVFPYALTFDTAALKPGKLYPGLDLALEASLLRLSISVPSQDGQFNASGPLHSLIQMAYNVIPFQVEGGPSWVRTDRYAIEATIAGNAPPDQMRAMLQSLLADRFKLTLRRETRTVPIYELVVADGGLKIAAMKEGECIAKNEIRWDLIDLEVPLFVCDGFRWRTLSQSPETRPRPQWPRVTRFEAGGTSMSALSDFVSLYVDRVVVDRTGFAAPFNLVLDFASPRNTEASGPTISTALQDQLGLQLRSTSGPVDVFVIDGVERPSEN